MDPRFAAIIRKAMARQPEGRYQDAASFQNDVVEWMRSAGVENGVADPLLGSRTPATSNGPNPGPMGETAVSVPGGGMTPLPGAAPTTPGNFGAAATQLSNTGGSLPGAASTAIPAGPKRTGPLVTVVAVVLAFAAGVVLVSRKKSEPAHESAAVAVPSVQAAAAPQPAATAAPQVEAPSAAASVALPPPSAAESASAPEAGPNAESHVAARQHVAASKPASAPKPAAAATPAPPTNSTAEQLKGRTIRTDL
jgi:hypothetical protein